MYKQGGKDSLETGSYRDISVTPILSKLLELLIMDRLLLVFEDFNIPHIKQVIEKKVSFTYAIFTTTEVLSHNLHQSETTYLCCYDLQKAYDTVEYNILCQLCDTCINVKLWGLIHSWYQSPKAIVNVGGELSAPFSLGGDVQQESQLLFQIVMDLFLNQAELANLGISYKNIYRGGSAQADDIRSLTSSKDCLEKQE